MGIDALITLAGLVIPPGVDFIKKKFLKPSTDTPEATMSSLATTSPDVLPEYLRAVVEHLKAKIEWFNRDVIGAPSQWIVDLRAAIRPLTVVVGLFALIFSGVQLWQFAVPQLDPGTRIFFEGVISSWFGSRMSREGAN